MTTMEESASGEDKTFFGRYSSVMSIILVLVLLAGLPIAVWLDLCTLSENTLLRQAEDLNSTISSIRAYYSKNVVERIQAVPGKKNKIVHNYMDTPGAIPIPATLSIELGQVISGSQNNIVYRFISDYPFKGRVP